MIGVSNVGERSAVLLRSTRYCSPEQSVYTPAEAQFSSRKARLAALVAARQGESETASMGGMGLHAWQMPQLGAVLASFGWHALENTIGKQKI